MSTKILILIGIAFLIVGAYFVIASWPQQSPKADEFVVCTQEARSCPDGSSVGRTGPKCEFAKCPGEGGTKRESMDTSDWKIYRNEQYGFEVKYPSDWKVFTGQVMGERSRFTLNNQVVMVPSGVDISNFFDCNLAPPYIVISPDRSEDCTPTTEPLHTRITIDAYSAAQREWTLKSAKGIIRRVIFEKPPTSWRKSGMYGHYIDFASSGDTELLIEIIRSTFKFIK